MKTSTSGRKPDKYQPRAQIKQMFQEGKLKAGDKKAIKEFSEKYIASEKLFADYIELLTDIEMRKISCQQIITGSVQKESNRNTITLTGKISITETSCHSLELANSNFILIITILHLKERKIRK